MVAEEARTRRSLKHVSFDENPDIVAKYPLALKIHNVHWRWSLKMLHRTTGLSILSTQRAG
jgi:hypothetical protein